MYQGSYANYGHSQPQQQQQQQQPSQPSQPPPQQQQQQQSYYNNQSYPYSYPAVAAAAVTETSRSNPHYERIPAAVVSTYQRQAESPLLWFAGPPVNVMPLSGSAHSIAYLKWKQHQQ